MQGAANGQFCWADLAAHDAERAKAFYAQLFGWRSSVHAANGGSFTQLRHAGRDIGSVYQLRRAQLEQGVPSHWTPYVRVADLEATAARADALGGAVVVRPFAISGVARIALIADAVGAPIGLWESLQGDGNGNPDERKD